MIKINVKYQYVGTKIMSEVRVPNNFTHKKALDKYNIFDERKDGIMSLTGRMIPLNETVKETTYIIIPDGEVI